MINNIIDTAFSGFWAFIGMIILLNGAAYYLLNFIVKLWGRFTRMVMVSIHGWPPPHLDADGDIITDNGIENIAKDLLK